MSLFFQSGRKDSNFRPLAPHASALANCATPRTCFCSDGDYLLSKTVAKVLLFFGMAKFFFIFFLPKV